MTRNRFQGNIDRFVSGSREMAKDGTGAVHTICPVDLHINDNKALSESTGSISIRFSYNGLLYDCVSYDWFIQFPVLENLSFIPFGIYAQTFLLARDKSVCHL
jgi:hypothetical protein